MSSPETVYLCVSHTLHGAHTRDYYEVEEVDALELSRRLSRELPGVVTDVAIIGKAPGPQWGRLEVIANGTIAPKPAADMAHIIRNAYKEAALTLTELLRM